MAKEQRTSRPWRQWYGTPRWRTLRKGQLADQPLCQFCAEDGRVTAATVVDHLENHKGDPTVFWAGPFQSLCGPCHSRHAQRRDHGRDIRAIGADGWPIGPDEPPVGGGSKSRGRR
jgi:hypothetical protein